MTLVVTESDFLADPRYSVFSGSLGIAEHLADSEQDLPFFVWGDKQVRAIKLLTAHRLAIAARIPAGAATSGYVQGGIQSVSESPGSQSVSFGNAAQGANAGNGYGLDQTVYGIELLRLGETLHLTGFVI